jgi:hypothetical protein
MLLANASRRSLVAWVRNTQWMTIFDRFGQTVAARVASRAFVGTSVAGYIDAYGDRKMTLSLRNRFFPKERQETGAGATPA